MRWMALVSLGLLVPQGVGAAEPKLHGRPIQELLACCLHAAARARIPPEILLAVAELEGGRPGQWVRNRNGSYDVGPMQFNTRYLKSLRERHGITADDVQDASCYPYELAAWRLGRHLRRDQGDVYTRAANYHSRNPRHNRIYRNRLVPSAQKWRRWLTEDQGVLHAPVGDGYANSTALLPVPPHRSYRLRAPERSWGTADTIRHLTDAFDGLPAGVRAVVLDVSLPGGGPMPHHRSHRHGRDVDISYFRRRCGAVCAPRTIRPDELDAARQWQLLKAFLPHAQYIFLSYALQRPLYEAARRSGTSTEALEAWFQYPRGPDSRVGVIRHAPNHRDHLHVRFRCPARQAECADAGKDTPDSGDLPIEEEEWLLRLLRTE